MLKVVLVEIFVLINAVGRSSAFVSKALFDATNTARASSESLLASTRRKRNLRASRSFEIYSQSTDTREATKEQLLSLLSETPSNTATSRGLTEAILGQIRDLENCCPTPESKVLEQLGGNWELLWTTQDRSSPEWLEQSPLRTWINPLENQSYSNNPNAKSTETSGVGGRANPILPRNIQDRLEEFGLIKDSNVVRSSQSVDLKKQRVRNVVGFTIPSPFGSRPRRASLTVDVRFQPNAQDKRRVDVKFEACRVVVSNSPLDVNIPLGFVGPTGWIRTTYIDETMRITRGHKGSVFILSRALAGRNG